MKRFHNSKRGANSHDVACPYCESDDTTLEQRKGSAICRKMFYCNACKQPFEQFD